LGWVTAVAGGLPAAWSGAPSRPEGAARSMVLARVKESATAWAMEKVAAVADR